jgi:hypothetical protein
MSDIPYSHWLPLNVRLPGAQGTAAQGELHRSPAVLIERVEGGSQVRPGVWLHRCPLLAPSR